MPFAGADWELRGEFRDFTGGEKVNSQSRWNFLVVARHW